MNNPNMAKQTQSFKWIVIFALLLVSLLVFSPVNTHAQESDGQIFVLVHGAFQDASAWSQIVPILEADGNTVIAVNLPGRGDDTTPINELSLTVYRDTVIEVIEAQAQPVILVGHSFGGMVISAVAEAIPDKIERLVYVAAYLPLSGESLLSISSSEPNAQDAGFIISDDGFISLPSDIFPFAFCPDCTTEQQTVVSASQLAEPVAPLAETVTLTEENFGRIPKTYILTAFDLAVSPTLQIMMLSKTPVEQVFGLQTGHVPYITASEALADLLLQTGISE